MPNRIIPTAVLLVVVVAACSRGAALPSASTVGSTPPPEATAAPTSSADAVTGMIDVGGHSLFYSCAGTGSPTVFMEHGLGGDVRQWTDVFREVSKRTRVCDYSRVNAKLSDSVSGTHTVGDSVRDAHVLLQKVGVPGPYVLVGFSWGGLVSQLFASTYPSDVAGLVLVDSNSADEARTYWKHLTPEQVAQDKVDTAGPNPEQVDILASFDEVRAAPPVPDVPLIVLTHTQSDPSEWPPGWDPKTFDALQAGLQADLVKLTSKGTQQLVEGGHDIPEEHPEAVVAAIDRILTMVPRP